MNFVTLTLGLVAVLLAFLLGRCIIVGNLRRQRCDKLDAKVKKLGRHLDYISNSTSLDREYEIEENDQLDAFDVFLIVYTHQRDGRIDACYHCLIKRFFFNDDRAFAFREAEELLEKLNEK